ncbi:MAG: aldo/keto reductase [Candidatus Aminicenantes bacterium]|nr:MAG: aldo/keto reductase [Candidatus Aminicenantes bacterium]
MIKMARISRRKFLKVGFAGIAGASSLTRCSSNQTNPGNQSKDRKIVFRTLGRTGLRLPVVSMGSTYGIEIVRAALDEGIVYIHTSSGYYERNHERLLGDVFQDRPRDSFVIGTSPDFPYDFGTGDRSSDLGLRADPDLILESIEGSLQRLKLKFLDIYWLLSIGRAETVFHEPYIRAYEQLKKSGKTRFVGIGTHNNEPDVIRAAAESGFWDVILTAYNFRQTHREDVREAVRKAAEAGLGVVAMKTQAGVYWDRTRLRKINMSAALKWVLQDENVHTTIPAFSNLEEMREDLSVMEDLNLTSEEIRDLKLGTDLGLAGLFCQQCRQCQPQCPAGLEIPGIMRAYMYTFGHKKPDKALETLRGLSSAELACRDCAVCPVQCALGFDVRSRALELVGFLENV